MPRYVIHIGPHKTGTTYLQHAFTALRSQFAARGIDYPQEWGGTHGHHQLATTLHTDASLRTAFDRLNRSGAETILLSSESFAYCSDAEVEALHDLLAGEPAIVVFYCRRWSELIPSIWRETMKHGSLLTLPEFTLQCLGDPVASHVVNFSQILARYARFFGPNALRIASYNRVIETGEDLLPHFCRHFLAWPDPPPTGLGRINESLDMVDSEIIRALNALEWTRAREGRQRLYHRYIAAKSSLPIQSIVEGAMQFTVDAVRIDDASSTLAPLHTTLSTHYGYAMVEPLPPEGLFAPRCTDVNYIRNDYLFADGTMEKLRGIHKTLLQAA